MKIKQLVKRTITKLHQRKPLFHSESHFVAWFAWIVKETFPSISMPELQVGNFYNNKRLRLDMLVRHNDLQFGLEMKYARASMNGGVSFPFQRDVYYAPKSGAAKDITRFNFLKDIERLESAVDTLEKTSCCALLVTNISDLWLPEEGEPNDLMYCLDDGITPGTKTWLKPPSRNTLDRTGESVLIQGDYQTEWNPFSEIPKIENGIYKYLAVFVE